MKTTAQKLIVIAIVAIFSLNMTAQNTKSVKESNFKVYLTEFVTTKMENAVNEISIEMENLESLVKFKPVSIDENLYPTEAAFDFTSIQSQLEQDSKYSPSDFTLNYESTDNNDLKNIQEELETVVKFNPSQSVVNSELSSIMDELAKDAKYVPSSNI